MRRIALFLSLALGGTIGAQQPVPSAPKDAGVATMIGILFPGGGQYYAEATGKGLFYTVVTALSVGVGATLSHGDEYRSQLVEVPPTPSNPLGIEFQRTLSSPANRAPFVAGAAVGGAVWLFAALTAGDDANAANARRDRVSAIVTSRRLGLAITF